MMNFYRLNIFCFSSGNDAGVLLTPVPPAPTVLAHIVHGLYADEKVGYLPHLDVVRIVYERAAVDRVCRMEFIGHRGVVYDNAPGNVPVQQGEILYEVTIVEDAVFAKQPLVDHFVYIQLV